VPLHSFLQQPQWDCTTAGRGSGSAQPDSVLHLDV